MQPIDAFHRLTNELVQLREQMELFQRQAAHRVEALKVEIGPEKWDKAYRIAAYLAIRGVIRNDKPTEFGDDKFEFE